MRSRRESLGQRFIGCAAAALAVAQLNILRAGTAGRFSSRGGDTLQLWLD
jgi:hypothetical protein